MKRLLPLILCFILVLTACGDRSVSLGGDSKVSQNGEPQSLPFIAEFYDNNGDLWLTTKGRKFNISPNKVKEYSYDNDGFWISQWTMSSVMSVNVDGHDIETCGSTVIIYDTSLTKYPCKLPSDYTDTTARGKETAKDPGDFMFSEYWTLSWWWYNHQSPPHSKESKIVMVQSQEGDPICLFTGDEVTWEVSRNLPKTTELTIDGVKLYIHRANFAIIDASIFTNES